MVLLMVSSCCIYIRPLGHDHPLRESSYVHKIKAETNRWFKEECFPSCANTFHSLFFLCSFSDAICTMRGRGLASSKTQPTKTHQFTITKQGNCPSVIYDNLFCLRTPSQLVVKRWKTWVKVKTHSVLDSKRNTSVHRRRRKHIMVIIILWTQQGLMTGNQTHNYMERFKTILLHIHRHLN